MVVRKRLFTLSHRVILCAVRRRAAAAVTTRVMRTADGKLVNRTLAKILKGLGNVYILQCKL